MARAFQVPDTHGHQEVPQQPPGPPGKPAEGKPQAQEQRQQHPGEGHLGGRRVLSYRCHEAALAGTSWPAASIFRRMAACRSPMFPALITIRQSGQLKCQGLDLGVSGPPHSQQDRTRAAS